MKAGSKYLILTISLVALAAVWVHEWRTPLLMACMLFLPMLDPQWRFPPLSLFGGKWAVKCLLVAIALISFWVFPYRLEALLGMFIFIVLPEEWFFRAYLLVKLEKLSAAYITVNGRGAGYLSGLFIPLAANIGSSVMFALLHLPLQGLQGLLVFFPSLVFGVVYQKTNDLILVVLLHLLSNICYLLLIKQFIG